MPSLRYVVGPSFAATSAPRAAASIAPQGVAPAPAPAKLDPAVTLGTIDEAAWTVTVAIPAYTLDAYNTLAEIRVYLLPAAMNGMVTPPSTGQAWKDSNFPVSVEDVSAYQDGADAVVPLPDVPSGRHLGQVVLGYTS